MSSGSFSTVADFNPRSREGSDSSSPPGCNRRYGFQSTLPRGERPSLRWPCRVRLPISIHAPARGATSRTPYKAPLTFISIHAPARGATIFKNFSFYFSSFQSTLPRGERRGKIRPVYRHNGFQSTLPRGERLGRKDRLVGDQRFQSTLPRGERLLTLFVDCL